MVGCGMATAMQRSHLGGSTVQGVSDKVLDADEVLYAVDGRVARLTINRPARRNAMTFEVVAKLRARFSEAKADGNVRAVVLSGAGDDAFCAGADLGGMVAEGGFVDAHRGRGELVGLFTEMWDLGKPTIARVQGYALAGGFGLALACDLIVASRRAQFGVPEIDVGLWPFMVTVPMLRAMPAKRVLELSLTGRRVAAEEAERIGFVNRVVEPGDLDGAVDQLAASLAAKSPTVVKLGRDAFYRVLDMGSREALAHLHALLTIVSTTEDAAEGVAAFAEKRPPIWTGR